MQTEGLKIGINTPILKSNYYFKAIVRIIDEKLA